MTPSSSGCHHMLKSYLVSWPSPTTVMPTDSSCRQLVGPGARCCHGFLKTWPQPSSSTLVWRPRAGAGFQLRWVRAVSTQVASWLQAPVVWENYGVSSACISDACTSATSVFSCLPGFCLPSTCLLFPLLMSQSLPVIKSAGIHRRGSIIFWQEDGNRTIPRSN